MERKDIKENVILVGSKPFLAYLKSVNTLFRGKKLKEIEIKARGKNIQKAVDLAESSRNKFCHDLSITCSNVEIGTETFTSKEDKNKEISVSTISITLKI